MTVTPTLPKTNEEWYALAVRWPRLPADVKAPLEAQMSRPEAKRFERTLHELHEDKRHFAGKLTTREDVAQILALYIDRNIMPFAARLDAMEKLLGYWSLPFYERWWIALQGLGRRILRWLEQKGIRFTTLKEADDEAGDRGDASREEEGAAAAGSGEVREGAGADRVQDAHVGRLEPSRIEVVRR